MKDSGSWTVVIFLVSVYGTLWTTGFYILPNMRGFSTYFAYVVGMQVRYRKYRTISHQTVRDSREREKMRE